MSELNIYQRLNEVRKKVGYLQKDASVQGYKAITHDAVTSAVREPFIKHGIMVMPSQTISTVEDAGETKNGTPIIRYGGWYEVSFVNIDNPEDKFTCKVEAHAMDQGDKAPGKAMSYAVKYALLKVLSIETGESEESRLEIAEKAKPTVKPGEDIWKRAIEALRSGKIKIEEIPDKYRITSGNLTKLEEEANAPS